MLESDRKMLLKAIRLLEMGDWEAAHKIAQRNPDAYGNWLHAILHKIEGDRSNAAYWYNRAGHPERIAMRAEEELKELAQELEKGCC
jgi:hypothetical protein